MNNANEILHFTKKKKFIQSYLKFLTGKMSVDFNCKQLFPKKSYVL